MLNKTMAFFLI